MDNDTSSVTQADSSRSRLRPPARGYRASRDRIWRRQQACTSTPHLYSVILKRYDIDRRPPAGAANADANYRDPNWLCHEYVDNHRSANEIADECDVCPSTIQRWLDVHDISIRDPPREREDGVCCYITDNDYHLVCVGDKTVGIHQLLALLKGTPAELVFGAGGDTVACHHANGCPIDNRLENIQPMDWASHSAFHRRATVTTDVAAAADVNAHCPLPTNTGETH